MYTTYNYKVKGDSTGLTQTGGYVGYSILAIYTFLILFALLFDYSRNKAPQFIRIIVGSFSILFSFMFLFFMTNSSVGSIIILFSLFLWMFLYGIWNIVYCQNTPTESKNNSNL
jgi:hypothetical protein